MADSFLQGAEIGGGLVARAMEQRRQNALLPLQMKEAQDALELNALRIGKAHNDMEIQKRVDADEVAVGDLLTTLDFKDPNSVRAKVGGFIKDHPFAMKTNSMKMIEEGLKNAEIGMHIEQRATAAEQRALDLQAARAADQLRIKALEGEQKMLQIKATTDAQMSRQLVRLQNKGKMVDHIAYAKLKAKIDDLKKDPEWPTFPVAKRQRLIDDLADKAAEEMKTLTQGQEAPIMDETTGELQVPEPEQSPAAAPPPPIKKVIRYGPDGKRLP